VPLHVAVTTVNGAERVFACFRSIENFPPQEPVKRVILDDGSCQDQRKGLVELAEVFGAEVAQHSHNEGISRSWNDCVSWAKTQKSDDIAILNDDIELLPGSLDDAFALLRTNPKVGLVGIPPYNRHATGFVLDWPADQPRGKPLLVPWPKGCSFVVRVEAWEAVEGWDTRFKSHFEDVDFALRLWDAGWLCVTSPTGALHAWSQTFAQNPQLQGHLRLEVSRRRFQAKWGKDMLRFPDRPSAILNWRGQSVETPFARW